MRQCVLSFMDTSSSLTLQQLRLPISGDEHLDQLVEQLGPFLTSPSELLRHRATSLLGHALRLHLPLVQPDQLGFFVLFLSERLTLSQWLAISAIILASAGAAATIKPKAKPL